MTQALQTKSVKTGGAGGGRKRQSVIFATLTVPIAVENKNALTKEVTNGGSNTHIYILYIHTHKH